MSQANGELLPLSRTSQRIRRCTSVKPAGAILFRGPACLCPRLRNWCRSRRFALCHAENLRTYLLPIGGALEANHATCRGKPKLTNGSSSTKTRRTSSSARWCFGRRRTSAPASSSRPIGRERGRCRRGPT